MISAKKARELRNESLERIGATFSEQIEQRVYQACIEGASKVYLGKLTDGEVKALKRMGYRVVREYSCYTIYWEKRSLLELCMSFSHWGFVRRILLLLITAFISVSSGIRADDLNALGLIMFAASFICFVVTLIINSIEGWDR